jgi:probable rRNA maturation factor
MINFHSEDVVYILKNKTRLKKWIVSTIEKKSRKAGEISFVFCSDAFLLKMNQQYLNHDTYTDIITFDYSEEENNKKSPLPPPHPSLGHLLQMEKGSGRNLFLKGNISGDIFISIERVKENAKKFSKTFEEELHRVIIHGTLHLLGYKDKTKAAKAEMTKQEDLCLKALQKI